MLACVGGLFIEGGWYSNSGRCRRFLAQPLPLYFAFLCFVYYGCAFFSTWLIIPMISLPKSTAAYACGVLKNARAYSWRRSPTIQISTRNYS